MDKVPIGRIDQPLQRIACSTCRKVLSENLMALAIQGKTVRCPGCRCDIKLSSDTISMLRRTRQNGR
ncbi:MAG: hypothetical protein ACYCW6_30475 [Candidatus Xenobia bacterium]